MMKKMFEVTKSELQGFTKTQLIKVAKSRCSIALKITHKKDEMISTILKAVRASKRLSLVVGTKVVIKKKATAEFRPKTVAVKGKPAVKAVPAVAVKAKASKKVKAVGKASVTRIGKSGLSPLQPKLEKAPTYESPENSASASSHFEEGRAEERVQDSKYYLATSQEHLQPSYEPPERYEDDRITAFVRDPFWIFSFWDINPQTEKRVVSLHGLNGNCKTTLRVYDITGIDFNGRNSHAHFDIEVNAIAGDWYVKVPEDGKTYCLEIGLKDSAGNFYMISRSNVIMLPRSGVSDRLDEEWMIADDEFWRMYAMSGGFAQQGSSEEIFGAMQKQLRGETSSGAVSSFGASEMMAKKKADDFWFRLDCELVVFGATRPDAEVTLGGKPIKLSPDGTFTERFAFPDGLQALKATALSANRKYEKTITPTVSRSTVALNAKMFEEEEEEE